MLSLINTEIEHRDLGETFFSEPICPVNDSFEASTVNKLELLIIDPFESADGTFCEFLCRIVFILVDCHYMFGNPRFKHTCCRVFNSEFRDAVKLKHDFEVGPHQHREVCHVAVK